MVVHPTAADQPPAKRRGATPYLYFVTGLPEHFRRFLVETAIFEVESDLKILFIEDGCPVPHDYVTTLKNYNMPVDNEEEYNTAVDRVCESVIDKLFDKESLTTHHVEVFLRANCDNFPKSFSEQKILDYMRGSVRVELLQVFAPVTKILIPVYNVYIFPPTRDPERLLRWRKWIAKQTFFTENYGVGVKHDFSFNCIHCKSIDHPAGLCPYTNGSSNDDGTGGIDDEDEDDELLPKKKGRAPQGPKPHRGVQPGRPTDKKGKDGMTERNSPAGGQPGANRTQNTAGPSRASKKRKMA